MTLLSGTGVFVFCFLVWRAAKKAQQNSPFKERAYIFPKLAAAFTAGYFGALFYDAVFKAANRGTMEFSGIAFYGGLIGGVAALWLSMAFSPPLTALTKLQWLDALTVPFAVFHFFGRIGCFLSGCCYGKSAGGAFGLHFPDRPAYGVFHGGKALIPTQLYEAAAILCIILLLRFVFVKNKFINYLLFYPAFRFVIEFYRGDYRGAFLAGLSPGQVTSILLFAAASAYYVAGLVRRKK